MRFVAYRDMISCRAAALRRTLSYLEPLEATDASEICMSANRER